MKTNWVISAFARLKRFVCSHIRKETRGREKRRQFSAFLDCDACGFRTKKLTIEEMNKWVGRPCPQCGKTAMITPKELLMGSMIDDGIIEVGSAPKELGGGCVSIKTIEGQPHIGYNIKGTFYPFSGESETSSCPVMQNKGQQ